jgi:hypothetical protein
VSEQTTCEPLSHENVAWAGIPQTTHPGSYQFLARPAKVGSCTEVRCQCAALHGKEHYQALAFRAKRRLPRIHGGRELGDALAGAPVRRSP